MGAAIYDLSLLSIFFIFLIIFLYKNRKRIKKEGWLLLYRTKWGIKLINDTGKKYKKLLKILSYVSIVVGYFLMISVLYLIGKIVYLYVAYPHIVKALKIPPIMPLIPYLPQIFKLDFLPPFYFIYWIVILAIIAIPHEFAHGIFASINKIKIKKTGFGFFPFFFPVFLAAFVELDEKKMQKKSNFSQMAVLSAGTFANVITAIISILFLWGFFSLCFTASGITFQNYAYSPVSIANISTVNNISINNASYQKLLNLMNNKGLNEIKTRENRTYLVQKDFLKKEGDMYNYTFLYDNAPAIKIGLEGAITEIDNTKISNRQEFEKILLSHSPGDKINLTTKIKDKTNFYHFVLGASPENKSRPYIGIAFANNERRGIMKGVINFMSSFKMSGVYYEPKFKAAWFIYDFLWWLVLISFSVALINMLPVGIFDGGRFFYLTILGITKNKKKAEKSFKFVTYFFLLLLAVLLVFWGLSFW